MFTQPNLHAASYETKLGLRKTQTGPKGSQPGANEGVSRCLQFQLSWHHFPIEGLSRQPSVAASEYPWGSRAAHQNSNWRQKTKSSLGLSLSLISLNGIICWQRAWRQHRIQSYCLSSMCLYILLCAYRHEYQGYCLSHENNHEQMSNFKYTYVTPIYSLWKTASNTSRLNKYKWRMIRVMF